MKVLVVGSVKQSPFIRNDINILSRFCDVDSIDIPGQISKDNKILQFSAIIETILFEILPKSIRSDVIYVWFADVHALPCLIFSKLFRKKCIIVIGGYEICNMPEINYGLQQNNTLRSKISRFVIKYADNCIVPSQSYYEKISLFEGKISILPTCSKIENYPEPVEKENIIVMVGNATKRDYKLKGIPRYDYIASNLSVPCYLIGDYDEEIKNKYKHIQYKGHLTHNEVLYVMNKAKIYCQLSYTESFGVSILEAMSVGCIPVVCDVDNLKNFIYPTLPGLYSNKSNDIIYSINRFLTIETSKYERDLIYNTRLKILTMCRERKLGLKKLMGVTDESMFNCWR